MTLSKNAFRSRLILARKLAHEQIVDQDKRLVWTSLQLQSLIFPVLVGFYFIFYFFPSGFLSILIYFRLTLSDSLLFFICFSPDTICNFCQPSLVSLFSWYFFPTPSVLYIFFFVGVLESFFHCRWFSSFLLEQTKLHGGHEIMKGFSLLNQGKDREKKGDRNKIIIWGW